MANNVILSIYNNSPVFVQNILCSLYGYREYRNRHSRVFHKKLDELSRTEWYSKSEIDSYQSEQLQLLITHCYNTVPYYKDLFDNLKLKPTDIKSKRDLIKIPVLTKELVREHANKLISSEFNKKKLLMAQTSGSTGKALTTYKENRSIQFQWALWWRLRERSGIKFSTKLKNLNFSGRPVIPTHNIKFPYWRFNKVFNQYIVPMQVILPSTINDLVEFINHNNFDYFIGYPSIIHNLCNLIKQNNLMIKNGPKYIFSGCEKLHQFQKDAIESTLNTTVMDQYGFAEGACNAAQCLKLNYHEDFEFGIMRVVNDDYEDALNGKILGTGFSNYAMPLINYEVGDYAIESTEKCTCGRESRIFTSIEGRMEDYVLTPEGNKIMRFDYLFKDTNSINEAQIHQHNLGEISIHIVKGNNYTLEMENTIRKKVSQWISPTIHVQFKYVNEIQRTRTGKFRAVISHLY